MSRLGPGQRRTEQGRAPPRIHPAFLQQKEYHPRGQPQIHNCVLQEGT
jgi:hypothetical protein